MTIQEEIKKSVDRLDEDKLKALLMIIHTWEKDAWDFEEVEPDEFDCQMIKEMGEKKGDDDGTTYTLEQVSKELGIDV